MATIDSLYRLFGVISTCSDDELRRAYHRAVLENHPDRNPDDIESSTVKTQQITAAYAELKRNRSADLTGTKQVNGENEIKVTVEGSEFTIRFSFAFRGIDVKDVAKRKDVFRKELGRFRHNPADPVCTLRLVHAAFRAERQDSIRNLLLNQVLIDAASLLLSLVQGDEASETLVRWAEILQENQKAKESIQILEDAFATGRSSPSVLEELRRLHYAWAQYADPTTGSKAVPEVRIEHLRRILELGFEYDYIHKFLAEAYHDLGDDEQARVHLTEAYRINPNVVGAVRISRALGFAPKPSAAASNTKARARYKYSRPEQIPSPSQICEWAQNGDWAAILDCADPGDYSPRILPRSRETLRQIAGSLERCTEPQVMEALTALLNFTYYWDVSEAAMTALSKVGDEGTLELLQSFDPGSASRGQAHLEACVSYLRARLTGHLVSTMGASPSQLLVQAERAFAEGDYGGARMLLENILASIDSTHSSYVDAAVLLARSCAAMHESRLSLELIKPVLALRTKIRRQVAAEVTAWLWSDLVSREYDPSDDEDYLLALKINLDLALSSKTPDGVLSHLQYLTRWLELLGEGDTAQWIRKLIRTEAPGTWYVDKHDREQYVRNVETSQTMKRQLETLRKRLEVKAVSKLRKVLRGQETAEDTGLLLNYG